VVDDDRALVDVLFELVTRSFPEAVVERCTSAGAALERMVAEDFNVVISDVRMPGLDGLGLLERAHALRPFAPVVLVTGVGDYDIAVRALRGGAFDFLTKPVDPLYFALTVTRALHANESARELDAQKASLREANRMKDEFLATLSHELRTPLTSILGWSRLMLRDELATPIQREALESIERNAAHQARLVEDLLDVSRIMTGKMRLLPAPVQLGHIVTMVLDTFAPALHGRRITLKRDVALANVQVNGDRDRLQQVVTNLLSNAAKFTSDGGLIDVTLRREGDHVRLTVSDDGVGIPRHLLPNIFERFHQVDGSLARSRTGLGLGLAIVKHIVELHNGVVQCSSAGEGHGASFTITLHASDVELVFPEERSGVTANLAGLRALVVEDDADARELFSFTLRQSGAVVVAVSSASAALAEMDRAVPDVILCDISLPDEDGYSFIRRVRQRAADSGGGVPAAAVTAYARREDVQRALAQGFDAHLAKPVEPRDITTMVNRLINTAHAHAHQRNNHGVSSNDSGRG